MQSYVRCTSPARPGTKAVTSSSSAKNRCRRIVMFALLLAQLTLPYPWIYRPLETLVSPIWRQLLLTSEDTADSAGAPGSDAIPPSSAMHAGIASMAATETDARMIAYLDVTLFLLLVLTLRYQSWQR